MLLAQPPRFPSACLLDSCPSAGIAHAQHATRNGIWLPVFRIRQAEWYKLVEQHYRSGWDRQHTMETDWRLPIDGQYATQECLERVMVGNQVEELGRACSPILFPICLCMSASRDPD